MINTGRLIPSCLYSGLLLCLAFISTACDRSEPETAVDIGAVAVVNGREISLSHLQAKHDFNHLSWSASAMPSADDLQRQYGTALSELIIAALVESELEDRGAAVNDEELKAAEDEVRADYPDDEFERTLVEDYIDIDVWRAFLFHRLSILKFSDLVLRPEISISSQEVEAYYQEHLADFTLPQREHFIVVDCDTKQTAEKLRKAYIQTRSQPLRNEDEDVNVREITANKERLPEPWLEALKGLKHKEASSIKSNEGRFQFIIFLDQLPEQVLDPASVYSRVEAGLMEGRMEQAFDAWLSEKVRKADIRVSQPLLEAWHKERSPETEEQDSYGLMGNVTAPAGDDDFYYDDEDQPEGGQI